MHNLGLSQSLLLSGLFTWVFCFLFTRKFLGNVLSLILSFFKALVPSVYFAYYFDTGWVFLDDVTYFKQGSEILASGVNPFLIIFDSYELTNIYSQSRGSHIFYSIMNAAAGYLLGEHYSSAVFVNVALSSWTALILYRLGVECKFDEKYSKGLGVYFSFIGMSFLGLHSSISRICGCCT